MRMRLLLLGAISALAFLEMTGAAALAITLRNDVAEGEYLAWGALPQFATAGLVRGGTTCATAGGTLINPEWVLTAAHCVPNSVSGQDVSFHLGSDASSLELSVNADFWFRHSEYAGDVSDGTDLALIHLETPILDVTPVRLFREAGELGQVVTVVGYGRSGTGLTGDTTAAGIRRGGTNTIDRYGEAIGLSSNLWLTDFDSPGNAADSVWGSTEPEPLESAIAHNDSGSPWYLQQNGQPYLAAVSSLRSSQDGQANSDYRDISAGTRVATELAWIDANHDQTLFAAGGEWNQPSSWEQSLRPIANHTVVIDQRTVAIGAVTNSSDMVQARYAILDGTGRLQLSGGLTTSKLVLRGNGTLELRESPTVDGDVEIVGGTVETSTTATLVVNGTFEAGGTLEIAADVDDDGVNTTFNEPTVRGTVNDYVLIAADAIDDRFASVDFAGTTIEEGPNYFGSNQNGSDGLFRVLDYDLADSTMSGKTVVAVRDYLALPGDANGDLTVDALDLDIWSAFQNQIGTNWVQADFNGDGKTDAVDFSIWSSNEGRTAPIDTPEPSAMAMGLCAALLLWSKSRRSGALC